MSIKKFKATVSIVKDIEIEVNSEVMDEIFMKEFSEGMFNVTEIEEIVSYIANCVATRPGYFIEGVGEYPKDYKREHNISRRGIHIDYNEWNDDVDVEVKEVV